MIILAVNYKEHTVASIQQVQYVTGPVITDLISLFNISRNSPTNITPQV